MSVPKAGGALTIALIALPAALAGVEATAFYATNRSNGTLVSSGIEREYLLYVPRSYDAARPTALVLTLHGGAMWPAIQEKTSPWNRVADEHGFLVVYPSAVSGRGPRAWRAGNATPQNRDVRFLAELVDTLRAQYNIDPTRIYANGLSNGGGMAFVLACTLPDRIAAVGLVATAVFLPWSGCPKGRPVPMLAFHGTADSAARYHGGKSWVAPGTFPDISRWVATWAARNGCAPGGVDSTVAPDVIRRVYPRCADGADVSLYTVLGGGHTWPGGPPLPEWFTGRTTASIDASREMWAFFTQHPLRPR